MRSASTSMRMACLALVSNPPGAFVAAFASPDRPVPAATSIVNVTASLIRLSRRKACTFRHVGEAGRRPPQWPRGPTIERAVRKINRPETLIRNDFRTSISRLRHPGERCICRRFLREWPDTNAEHCFAPNLERRNLDLGDARKRRPRLFGIVRASERSGLDEKST